MTVYIGADHRGFQIKTELISWMRQQGWVVVDCGNTKLDPDDDYPDFAFAVAELVAKEPESRGVVICGSGVGVCVAANKVAGIRCSLGLNPEMVAHARAHDDLNVLACSSDFTSLGELQKQITAFLKTPFSSEARHQRRLDKIRTYTKHA